MPANLVTAADKFRMLDWIAECARKGKPCPTNDQIIGKFGFSSPSTAARMIEELEKAGVIRVERTRQSRVVEIVALGFRTAATAAHDAARAHPSTVAADPRDVFAFLDAMSRKRALSHAESVQLEAAGRACGEIPPAKRDRSKAAVKHAARLVETREPPRAA